MDAFSLQGVTPSLHAGREGWKPYEPYLQHHRVIGGLAPGGAEVVFALGNPSPQPRTFHVLVFRDGEGPPEGKELLLDLQHVGVDHVVNDKVQVVLCLFPVPYLVHQGTPTLGSVLTLRASQTGLFSSSLPAPIGRNRWAVFLQHDIDAREWFYAWLSTYGDIWCFWRLDRAPDTYILDASGVTPNNPDALPAYPGYLPFFSGPQRSWVSLGQVETFAWKESPAQPNVPLTGEPANNLPTTAQPVAYSGWGGAHTGYVFSSSYVPRWDDEDWYALDSIPVSDRYRFVLDGPFFPGLPARAQLFFTANPVNPVWSLEHAALEWSVTRTFLASQASQYLIKIDSPFGAVGEYAFSLRLEDEEEEPEEGWGPVVITPSPQWRTHRVSATNPDQFEFMYQVFDSPMKFLVELRSPAPTYSRGSNGDFPVAIAWSSGNIPGPNLNGHPSAVKAMSGWGSSTFTLSTPVIPGRRVQLRLPHWEDKDEPNDVAALSKPWSDQQWRYRSLHLESDVDWYHLDDTTPTRQYRLTFQPTEAAFAGQDQTRVQVRVFQDDGVTPVFPASGWATPDGSGRTVLVFNPPLPGQLKVVVQAFPAGSTGAYTMERVQRIRDDSLLARWRFNGNWAYAVPSSPYQLAAVDGAFLGEGSGYGPESGVHFPSTQARLVSSGAQLFLPTPTTAQALLIRFWIKPDWSWGTGSRGWVMTQEDRGGTIQFGIEQEKTMSGYRIRVHSGSAVLAPTSILYRTSDIWNLVTVMFHDFSPGKPLNISSLNTSQTLTWGAGTFGGTPDRFTVGNRRTPGTDTNLKAGLDDLRIYKGVEWQANDYEWLVNDPS